MQRFDTGSRRQEAEETYRREFDAHKQPVERRVRRALQAAKMDLASTDLEEAYLLAWQKIYLMIAKGDEVKNLGGMLYRVTERRAVDLYRELHTAKYATNEVEQLSSESDVDALLDDQAKLQRLLRLLGQRLSDRECTAFVMTVVHGYTRPEVAEMLGLTRKQIERLADRAMRKASRIVAIIDARGCGDGEWTRLLRAYALGALDAQERDYARVETHLQECQSCARYVTLLEALNVALLPPVWLLPPAAAGGSGGLALLRGVFVHHHTVASVAGLGGSVRRIASWAQPGSAGFGSTLNAGAAVKGAAAVAVVAATVGVVTHGQAHQQPAHTHNQPAHHVQAAAADSQPEDIAPATQPSETGSQPGQAKHPRARRKPHRTHSARQSGVKPASNLESMPAVRPAAPAAREPSRTVSAPVETVRPASPPAASRQPASPTSSSNVSASQAAAEEFGFERR